MQSFNEWLIQRNECLDIIAQLQLLETYYSYDPAQYDALFNRELEMLAKSLKDPNQRQRLESMRDFKWTAYIESAVRSAGFTDYRDLREKTHDIIAMLLTGRLFRGFDSQVHGPMDKRFRAVWETPSATWLNCRNRQRYLPISHEFRPGAKFVGDIAARQHGPNDEAMIEKFRSLVQRELGSLALAILDARLGGDETKGIIGRADLGKPSRYDVKMAVQAIKKLARDFASRSGDSSFVKMIERAMATEAATVEKRRAAVGKVRAVG